MPQTLRVAVVPSARKEKVEVSPPGLRIWVREPAERNAANNRVRQLIALHYGIPISAVRWISGRTSQIKTFEILDLLPK